ncbi:zf-TFIIB domain-containing protein [Marinobacter xestospongiae]|uniref:zf-TFIIB domain-containing protein n=1 Tax=Marinobacter xestospongiae TaxID=994319 RepID=UPI0037433EF1
MPTNKRRAGQGKACRQCGGAWLDFNDLEGIRQLFSSNEERQRLSEEFSNSVLNDPHLQVLKTEEEHQIGRMNYLASNAHQYR